jgi:hypothetical protein
VGDAAWLARYAKDRRGESIPWALLEQEIRETHAYEVRYSIYIYIYIYIYR